MPDLPSQRGRRPEILLDHNCRIGYCENSTSAKTENSKGLAVEVSFEIRDPPALSLCFAGSHGLIWAGSTGPTIVSSAGGLVLLHIDFSRYDGISPSYWDYFVYRAGPGAPSLHLLPGPYPTCSSMTTLTVLPIGDVAREHYAVVFPSVETDFIIEHLGYRSRSTLQIYRTDRKAWCTAALAPEDSDEDSAMTRMLSHGVATSVVDARSGLVGWVDLWYGVLLCNVLDEKPTVRFVPVPVPQPGETPSEWNPSEFDFNPRPFRQMTVHDGVIKFIELYYHRGPAFNPKRRDDQGWMATTWTRPISSHAWDEGTTFDTSDLSVDDPSFLHLLPEILDEEKKLTWVKVPSSAPTMSLHDDDIVYIMVRMGLYDPTALLLAVNTKNLTLESCAQCSCERMLEPEPGYDSSVLSSYFDLATSAT